MMHLFFVILPILVVDVVNPILLAGTIYGLGSKKPFGNGGLVLFSFFISYFLVGLFIAIGLESFEEYFRLPRYFDYVLELLVALLLFYMAVKQYREGDAHREEKLKHKPDMTPANALLLGVQINVVGLPFAVPYLAAIDQILKADVSLGASLLILFLYNAFYVLPYSCLFLIRYVYPKESSLIFEGINNWMHRLVSKWMPLIFCLLGLLLVEDAVSFLIGYREYSFLELI